MHIDAREYAKKNPKALEAPQFTDLDGKTFQREQPLSVLEYNDAEADWQAFLLDAAQGQITKENFRPRAEPIITAIGWPADRVLALPNELFWDVMSGFFASPEAEGKPPATETGPAATSLIASSPAT